MKIRDKLNKIKSKYKHITKYKFLYNKPGDLRRKYNRVVCHMLIFNEEKGHSLMEFTFKRTDKFFLKWWRDYLITEGVNDVFIGKVLASINNRPGASWVFRDMVCWRGYVFKAKKSK